MRSKAVAASSRESTAPLAVFAISALNSSTMRSSSMQLVRARTEALRQLDEVLQEQMAVLGSDALGMKLDAMHGPRLVLETHDQTVIGLGSDLKIVRHGVARHHQRVVTRRLERTVDAAE